MGRSNHGSNYVVAVKIGGKVHLPQFPRASEADSFGKVLSKLPGVEGVLVADGWGEKPPRFEHGEKIEL